MAFKRWAIAQCDRVKASAISQNLNIDTFVANLLVSRGIDDELAVSEFLSDSRRLVSPFKFTDMEKAARCIKSAVEQGERICIYGDYDCDGVTATALLYTFLESLGADVSYYIPNRLTDGYGMNKSAIDEIKSRGTQLIVTVDNGISATDEAEYIYSLGMHLVVTDHHQVGNALPRAEAVVNPHREECELEFRDFAGVGVAFKLACAIYDGDAADLLALYADLVTLGTIADIMPLLGENRTIVKAGISSINNGERCGIAALKEICKSDGEFTSTDIAFQLCPRINAAGRMESAIPALELLMCDNMTEAQRHAEMLNGFNLARHNAENQIEKDISLDFAQNPSYLRQRVIVAAGEGYHKGVIGICAAHLVEKYGKPAIVIGIDESGKATASARSIDGFNIYNAIASCSDLLGHFGGHPSAAGFSLDAQDIPAFRQRINEYAAQNYPVMPQQCIDIDLNISPFYLSLDLCDSLAALEPFGEANKEPIIAVCNMTLDLVEPIGNGNHIRLRASKKGKAYTMLKFGARLEDFPYKIGEKLDFAIKISKNIYRGRASLSIRIVDVRKSGIDQDRYFEEKNDFELFELGNKNKKEIYPTREVCSVLYRYLKSVGEYRFTLDDLYFELAGHMTYGQLQYALRAFEETGLITRGDKITVNAVASKVSLDETKALTALKGRM